MSMFAPVRTIAAAAFMCLMLAPQAGAQQKPSPAAVSTATEILQAKGGIQMYDTVIAGVIEHHKNLLTQVNPTAAGPLNALAGQLQKEYAGRTSQMRQEIAIAYASQFTEQELKDILAFYRTPLGKKLIDGEPKAIDEATKRADEWAGKFAQEIEARMRADMKKRGINLM